MCLGFLDWLYEPLSKVSVLEGSTELVLKHEVSVLEGSTELVLKHGESTRPIESESKTTETGILLTSSFSLFFILVWLNQFFFSSLFFPHLCFFSVEVKGKRSTIMRILYRENYAKTKNTRDICFFFFGCISFVNHFLCNVILIISETLFFFFSIIYLFYRFLSLSL